MIEQPKRVTELSADRLRSLISRVKEKGGSADAPVRPRQDPGGAQPLSFAQERLWFLDRLGAGSAPYAIPSHARLSGPLDAEVLARTFAELARRHESLRTTFGERQGVPFQEIAPAGHPAGEIPMPQVDLAGLPGPVREGEMLRLAGEEARRPFDLARGPLLRNLLVRLGPEDHVLATTMHHIVSDGWSMTVLIREMAALYEAFSAGRLSPLPEPALQYADFAVWQREHLRGERLVSELAWWRERLAGVEPLPLLTDRPRPAVQSHRGARRRLALSSATAAGLRALGQREGASLFMVLLAFWDVLLHRCSGHTDLAVGTPVANRNRGEVQGLIGFFVNTLVLRTDLAGRPRFRDLLGRVRETALEAWSHDELPFGKLVEHLQPERLRDRNPLFQVMCTLQNQPWPEMRIGEVRLTPLDLETGLAKLDLSLTWSEGERGLEATLEHSTDLFDGATAQRLLRHCLTLVREVLDDPERSIDDLPLLSAAERTEALAAGTGPATGSVPDGVLHALFEEQAALRPDAVAVEFEDASLTFAALEARANQLARALRRLGAGPGAVVGFHVPRSLEMIAGLFGVLKSGAAYLPLDFSHPRERLAAMIEDCRPVVLLTLASVCGELPDGPVPLPPIIRLDADREIVDRESPASFSGFSGGATADDLVFVMYTSGSTGRPKGVMAPHRGLLNRFLRARELGGVGPHDVVLHKSPMAFDFSVWEALGAITAGGRTVVARPDGHVDFPYLARLLDERGVTIFHFVPTLLEVFLAQEGIAGYGTSVRQVLTGGEALTPALRDRFFDRFRVPLDNQYGPTEGSIDVTWERMLPDGPRPPVTPIGRPHPWCAAHVLAPSLDPLPPGIPGELFLGGVCLARGYLDRPDLTAERFVPDPFGEGGRLYRTGDLARRLPGGAIDYLGRIDHQVKIRGVRIEPGEIEAALLRHPRLREAAVVVQQNPPGKRLMAFFAAEEPAPDARELRALLARTLPETMVPAAFVRLGALPRLASAKIDRGALARLEPAEADSDGSAGSPRTPVEGLIAGIWSELLGVEAIGSNDDFFALGGHSLLAVQVVSRLRDRLGVEIAVRTLFDEPTLAGCARRVELALRGEPAAAALRPVPRDGLLPLSFAQQRLWFLDQLAPDSPVYNVPAAVELAGRLDVPALAAAFGEVVRRHEALRTTFRTLEDGPVQVIAEHAGFALPLIDLQDLPGRQGAGEESRLATAEARRPFDLATGPLLRATLLRTGAERHVLLLAMHHIVSDGWSMGVLVREIGALYTAFATSRPSPLPELAVQYADFAAWQRRYLSGELLETELAWWRAELAGMPPALDLPTDHPRPAAPSGQGAVHGFAIDRELCAGLTSLSRQHGATLFMTLLAGFAGLLGRTTGQDDLAVGTPIAGRTRVETEPLIGCFVNTLVLRTDLAKDPGLEELLGRVRTAALSAWVHQEVPFERLVEELAPERDSSRPPLVQAVLVLQNAPSGPDLRSGPDLKSGKLLPGLALTASRIDTGTAKFELTCTLIETERGLEGTFEYSRDLFERPAIERLAGHFTRLLAGAVADPRRRLSELPFLSPQEQAQILVEWSGEATAYPREATIHALFAEQAALRPDAVAVEGAGTALTYGELRRRAGLQARRLRALGVGPEVRVGVCLDRSPARVVATLAVLEAGGAYVPLDPSHPRERLESTLRASAAVLCIDGEEVGEEEPAAEPIDLPEVPASALAYVMYTSGSTGEPKGVAVPHRAVARLVRGTGYARFGPDEVFLQLAPYAFDASTLELWGALLNGGRAVMPPPGVLSPAELGELLADHGVTTLWLTAGLFHQMVEDNLPGLAGVRQLLAGGDVLSPAHVRRVVEELPGTRLINGYGPTENTTFTCCHLVSAEDLESSVPLGRPIANTWVYVLDRNLAPVPVGVAGELCAGGDGLARGYLDRPEWTAERFLPHPFEDRTDRLYRTGDLARYRPDGRIEFLGRIDTQVKIRGFRIEPGEIETELARHAGVREAAVVARPGRDGQRLVAYIVPASGWEGGSLRDELRTHLRQRLPEPMIPSAFLEMPSLPLNTNGKLDRAALPEPDPANVHEEYVAPRTPVEALIAGIWAEVLGLERVGVRSDFFALGGHSLLATRVVTRVRQALGVDLGVRELFDARTVAGLALAVTGEILTQATAGAAVQAPAIPSRRGGLERLPLSFSQERLWFLDRLDPGAAVYNMPAAVELRGRLHPAALAAALSAVVRRHESLRTTFAEVGGVPVQRIAPPAETPLPRIDLAALPEEARQSEAGRLATEHAARRFDLACGPLFAAALLRLGTDCHRLLLVMHHIVSDGWSMGILIREVAALYGAFVEGRPAPLPELAIQYADFALWQRETAAAGRDRDLAWWSERLAGPPAPLDLPMDRPRPAVQTWRGGSVVRTLSADLSMRLRSFSQAEGASLFMTLLAGTQALFHRLAGQDDIVVGSPIAGRRQAETEPLIGFFLNLLALRTDLSGDPGFRALVARVREVTLSAYAHQDLPFEALLAHLQPERDLARTPLFQVLFNMLNLPEGDLRLPGLELAAVALPDLTSKFDLTFYVHDDPGQGVAIRLVYNADLFDAVRMEELLDQLTLLLAAGVETPDLGVRQIPLVATPRARSILPDPAAPLDAGWIGSIHAIFSERARSTPERPAVSDRDGVWTCGELDAASGRLAGWLLAHGLQRGERVAIWAHRSAPLVLAVLGALKAGGAFVVLDPAYPPPQSLERLRLSCPRALLRLEAAGPVPDAVAGWIVGSGCAVIDLPAGGPGAALERLAGAPDVPAIQVGPDDSAVVGFTSGSTGVPKAILGRHGPLTHFLPWQCERFGLSTDDRFTVLSSLAHDPLQRDLFTPLFLGAAITVPAPEDLEVLGRIAAWMARERVTVAHLTPAMAQLLTERPPGGELEQVPSLRRVLLVGDALTRRDVRRIRSLAPQVVCINLYGSTETQRAVGYHVVEDAGDAGDRGLQVLPLGRGMQDVQLLVVNRAGLAGIGEVGEIAVRSPHLARGYLGDAALTAERFVPFRGDRVYRTGDLGRYLPGGEVVFAGRADLQVKIRGFRIEPAEIEAAIGALPGVREAVVLAREERGEKRLVAWVVPEEEGVAEVPALRQALRERLPAYMVPADFVLLERLPLTPNGKVDRRALPAPDRTALPDAVLLPHGPIEERLAGIWAEVLGVERVGPHDDFFALGGHSILATVLMYRVRQELGVDLPLRTLFVAPTVAGLASAVAAAKGEARALPVRLPRIVPDPSDQSLPFPLTEVQEAYWIGRGAGMELGSVATHSYFETDVTGLDVDRLEAALRLLIERHGMLRAIVQPDGRQRILPEVPPYVLGRLDLRTATPEAAAEALERVRAPMSHQVLPSDRWPLFEVAASLLPGGMVRLHVSVDLLISDAWSLRLLAHEIGRLYEHPEASLPPLEISFRDYVLAETALRESAAGQRDLEYWRGRLAEIPPPPALPLARNPAAIVAPRFVRRRGELPAACWDRLKERAAQAGLTPSGLLLAAWSEVLAAWSGSSRFTLNLTLFNRLPLHPQVGQVMGDFTSLTLLAVERHPGEKFVEGARRLQERLWDDLDHRLVSGVRVLRELSRLRREPRTIMPVVFTSTLNQASRTPAAEGSGLRGQSGWGISQTPQVWLDHQVTEVGGTLVWSWDAVEELFPAGLLDDMLGAYVRLLERLGRDETAWREPVRGLLPAEQLELIAEANATAAPLPQGLLHRPFLEQARRAPDAPAVITSARTLTYGELDRLSLNLAHRLRRLGAGPNRLVAVVMHKGWEQVAAVLAVLRAGAAYLPVDARLPAERLRHLLVRGEAAIALTQPGLAEALSWPEGVERVVVESKDDKDDNYGNDIEQIAEATDLAYVIFTSGSTGEPKGVMIDHRGALNTVIDVNRRFAVGPGDRVLALSSLSFDLSVWDIFGVLAAGGALVLPEPGSERDPAQWAELAARERVTVWNTVPALMEMLVEHGTGRPEAFATPLRLVLLSGDWIPVRLPDRIRAAFPGVRVISLGGATEASIWSILFSVGEVGAEWTSIPYGRAMANQSFHVLDDDLEPCPVWVPGHLCIGGAGLARGYWRDEETTRAAFLDHPRTGERLYRTGDRGRLLPSGDIEFLGRDDTQVKVQGHRIELGEIEAALTLHPAVSAAVVAAVGERHGPKQLVGYVVPQPAAPERPAVLTDPVARLRFKLARHGERADEGGPAIALRRPELAPEQVEALYLRRRSFRRFLREPIPLDHLAGFLSCLLPVEIAGAPFPKRRYGSAGNLYPVQTWLHVKAGRVDGLAGGVYYHDPRQHRLVLVSSEDRLDAALWDPTNRAVFEGAAFAVFLIARLAAIAPLYGERARHFATLEAGLMTQLLETAAPDHRIGLAQMGGLRFEAVRQRFALDDSCELVHTLLGGRIDAAETGLAAFRAEMAEQQALVRLLAERPEEIAAAAAAPAPRSETELFAALREHLRSRLPEPLVPALWVRLDALPLSANGKVDRKALPPPEAAPAAGRPDAGWAPPETEIEKALAGLVAEALGVRRVGLYDNFFDLGASSVHIVRVHNALRERLGTEIPIVEMFNHPSVSHLARRLAPEATAPDPGAERSERLREGKDWRRQRLEKRRAAGGL